MPRDIQIRPTDKAIATFCGPKAAMGVRAASCDRFYMMPCPEVLR